MRRVLGALLLCLAVACSSSDSTSPGNGALSGNYTLRTANGVAVPGVASQDATGIYEVLHGRIVLRSDLTFVDSLNARFTPTGGSAQTGTDVREGVYEQNGDNVTLTFTYQGAPVNYALTWVDVNTLAYSEPQLSLIYKR